MGRLYAITTTRGGPKHRDNYLANSPRMPRDRTIVVGLVDARRFSTPGDASAWMDTHRINQELCAVVGILPAATREAEAAARAEWIDRGGRVAS